MTTIATDGITIAADGRETRGSRVVVDGCVKIHCRHGRIYALSGTTAMTDAVIKWHHEGADPAKVPKTKDNDWWLVVVDKDGVWCVNADCPYLDKAELPFATGSGHKWAEAAMLLGKGPREAVEFAALQDLYTGGEIVEFHIATTLAGAEIALENGLLIVPAYQTNGHAEALQ